MNNGEITITLKLSHELAKELLSLDIAEKYLGSVAVVQLRKQMVEIYRMSAGPARGENQ